MNFRFALVDNKYSADVRLALINIREEKAMQHFYVLSPLFVLAIAGQNIESTIVFIARAVAAAISAIGTDLFVIVLLESYFQHMPIVKISNWKERSN